MLIYLDNNATTRVADEVLDAMEPFYREFYGNPHSPHALGRRSQDAIELAREQVASLVSAATEEIYFTSCGTESNALVIRGCVGHDGRKKIVTTSVEHPSVLALLRALESDGQIKLVTVPVNRRGEIDLRAMDQAIDETTALVTVMLAQNETGVVHPVAEIAVMAHRNGARLHVDAVQAAGKIPIHAGDLDADFLSISGHKFHAPKGIGALFVRRGISIPPLWYGGGQEYGMRSGTEAVPSIVGLGAASELALARMELQQQVERLRDRFESIVLSGTTLASVNGSGARLPNTSNISFSGINAGRLVFMLDRSGLCASGGSACQSSKPEPSAVMTAMGVPVEQAAGAIRFSLSRYTTADEIEQATPIILNAIATLTESPQPASA